jgi:hypothetical protein
VRIFLISSIACICPGFSFAFQETGQDGGVVKDDAVGDQAAAFRPQVLFILGLETELTEAGEGYRSSQLVGVFSPVDRFLDVLNQGQSERGVHWRFWRFPGAG